MYTTAGDNLLTLWSAYRCYSQWCFTCKITRRLWRLHSAHFPQASELFTVCCLLQPKLLCTARRWMDWEVIAYLQWYVVFNLHSFHYPFPVFFYIPTVLINCKEKKYSLYFTPYFNLWLSMATTHFFLPSLCGYRGHTQLILSWAFEMSFSYFYHSRKFI